MSESHPALTASRKDSGSFLPLAAIILLVVFGPALLAWGLTMLRR